MAIGETNQERRNRLDANEEFSLSELDKKEIKYKKLGDFHFLIDDIFDYWPRTGLFIQRGTGKRGRGFKNLINRVEKGEGER